MSSFSTIPSRRGSILQRMLRGRVLQRLTGLQHGALCIRDGHSEITVGNADGPFGTLQLQVRNWQFFVALSLRGALGAGESFVAGHWGCAEPAQIVRLLLRDRSVLQGVDRGISRWCKPLLQLGHALRRNTRTGSRKNIAAHYDLGDDFFALFLDDSMTYSSAVFPHRDASMAEGQQHKLRRLCQKLALSPRDHLLEIGSGWGSMAVTAGRDFGARVTTTTISARQLRAVRERVLAAGLAGRVEALGSDYRDLQGQYDKIVSVEMIEAVGHHYLPTFFRRCSELLRPGGVVAMQAITIADQHYEQALRRVDFIKRYVFPGSFIPSVTALVDAATLASDLRLCHLEDFGQHYAETLRRWRLQLQKNTDAILQAGYPESLVRTWEWYLAYCEGGFAEGYLGVAQLLFARPGITLSVPAALPQVAADPYGPAARPA
ncbi:MAG: cyclopropane-fatty-acyl-phospholipid synthase family protein [Planctomycetota bacterium]|jgi:cyclopropane-fatty-acyl-phospholipid synthase|nr:cyclopropane-fatty-acyl-phospholipid synthase [Planctomycetota bacterium]MSR40023.1 class I SAM-dependent methyltransferase [Planctomycetota bacterium]